MNEKSFKKGQRFIKNVFIIFLVFFNIFLFSELTKVNYFQNDVQEESSLNFTSDNSRIKTNENSNFNLTYKFDIESLFNYLKQLYSASEGVFKETAGESYKTSIATYEALSSLRYLGLDYYLFGADWQKAEDTIADYLLIKLEDSKGSGGYRITPEAKNPSLEGTFGVVASLWLMNEPILKEKTIEILDFIINDTFNFQNRSFHEIGQQSSIKATFQALNIINLCYKIVIKPELKDILPEVTEKVNVTVIDFMTNYLDDLSNYLDSKWVDDSYFDSKDLYQTRMADTWYSMNSIQVLDQFSNLLGINLTKELTTYKNSVIDWIKSQVKSTGKTMGGIGSSEYATVAETGMGYAILHLLNSTDEINHTETIKFINSSQFINRENRSYLSSEKIHFGGFSPNNLSHPVDIITKRVNVHDTYFAVLTLLLSGDIFNSLNLSLTTSQFKNNPITNKSNLIVQGDQAQIEQFFNIYNYKSHGSLRVSTFVDNWNITYQKYSEQNADFRGKLNANYKSNLENDSESNFNWTLGNHILSNFISIRDLPIIISPIHQINSTLFVSYSPKVEFNNTLIKPGENISFTVFYQNKSTINYSTENITSGLVSVNITSPDNEITPLLDKKPFDPLTEAIIFYKNFTKQDLLGQWILRILYNDSNFEILIFVPIDVSDTVFLYNLSKVSNYYPGEKMNLNISLMYTNGQFTPKANASLVFSSNKTQKSVFSIPLDHLENNVYTTSNSTCPIQFLYGFYNVSAQITWNSSSGYIINTISNKSLPIIQIKGDPIFLLKSFKTDYRNLTLKENNLIYYGETINLSFNVGFKSPSNIHNITDSKANIKGGLVNNTVPSSFIQNFNMIQKNDTISAVGLINTNYPSDTYGTRFKIVSKWNDSLVEIRDPLNNSNRVAYNITLLGEFTISDVTYIGITEKNGNLIYALDSGSLLSVSFKIMNIANSSLNSISVPNLNLYGILDVKNNIGVLNQSLPSITSAIDQNGTSIYQISIPSQNLKARDYEISIYTWTAIMNHYEIGLIEPGFTIVRTLEVKPIIQIQEALIILAGIGVIFLSYLNYRKIR